MKLVVCLSLTWLAVSIGFGAEFQSPTFERKLKADVLRDFQDACWAWVQCRPIKAGDTWDLKPFCGISTCVKDDDGVFHEQIRDCGVAKKNDACAISEKSNFTLNFPYCKWPRTSPAPNGCYGRFVTST